MPLEIDIPQMSLALQLVLIRPRISQTVMNKHFEYLHFLQRRKKIDFSKHPMWPSPYSADNSQQVSLSLSPWRGWIQKPAFLDLEFMVRL